ncbi:MAG: hydrogenase nickel incorporation protein HypA [Elusimicrobia bacterium]|nr:hydrogenase nickel incorporation protein HypA [Elusimicrobiota bacterium]
MHEWALAESVVKSASKHAASEKLRRLSEIGVVLGELQAIDRDIFSTALRELLKDSPPPACGFKLIEEAASFKCRPCGREFTLEHLKKTDEEGENIHFIPELAHAFLACPACASPDFEVKSGRGVYIKYLKGEK